MPVGTYFGITGMVSTSDCVPASRQFLGQGFEGSDDVEGKDMFRSKCVGWNARLIASSLVRCSGSKTFVFLGCRVYARTLCLRDCTATTFRRRISPRLRTDAIFLYVVTITIHIVLIIGTECLSTIPIHPRGRFALDETIVGRPTSATTSTSSQPSQPFGKLLPRFEPCQSLHHR